MINCGNTAIFQRLMSQVVELPGVAADPACATNQDRVARREPLFALLQDAFGKQAWSHWQPRMRSAAVPCGELRSVGEAIRSPEARENAIATRIPHPALGAGLGAKRDLADPLCRNADGQPGAGAACGPAHPGRAGRLAGP